MRKIDISSRNENTRDKIVPDRHIPKLTSIKEQFDTNIASIREKCVLAEKLHNSGDLKAEKDIFRSQIVFLDSALDYYMHCLGIYATEQMYESNWIKTEGYKDLKVPIDKVMYAISHPEDSSWINEAIISHHASKTYMSAKEIKGQFTFVIGKDFYKKVADEMYYDKFSRTSTEAQLTNNLQNLFDRRNQIAHQADRNHTTGEEYNITKEETIEYIDFIENFVNCVHGLLIN